MVGCTGEAHITIVTGKYSTSFKAEAEALQKGAIEIGDNLPEPCPMWSSLQMLSLCPQQKPKFSPEGSQRGGNWKGGGGGGGRELQRVPSLVKHLVPLPFYFSSIRPTPIGPIKLSSVFFISDLASNQEDAVSGTTSFHGLIGYRKWMELGKRV